MRCREGESLSNNYAEEATMNIQSSTSAQANQAKLEVRFQVPLDIYSSDYPLIEVLDYETRTAEKTCFGVSTFQLFFRTVAAPACSLETREVIAGTILQRLLPPDSYYSGKGGEFDLINSQADCLARAADWLGLMSRVYLLNCFNYSRATAKCGFRNKNVTDLIYGREPNPLDLMRTHPLTVIKMGWRNNSRLYTLQDDNGVVLEEYDQVLLAQCKSKSSSSS